MPPETTACPFCGRIEGVLAEAELVTSFLDGFPVSTGHALIVPKRHAATYFDCTSEEKTALWALVDRVKERLEEKHRPDGFNVGFNAGAASGQTVAHAHIHVIPRYSGDVPDPRGGVRHVIPAKGNYLSDQPQALVQGGDDPFLRHQAPLWAKATEVAVIAAFVQESGLDLLRDHAFAAMGRGARVRIITGDYLAITQAAALEQLLDWASLHPGRLEARVVETERLPASGRSFHPKSWRFEGPELAVAFVGSSNVSRSALSHGVEWNLRLERARDPLSYRHLFEAFEGWWARARPLDSEWVRAYGERAQAQHAPPPPGEAEDVPLEAVPPPHPLQTEALAALVQSREAGRRRALVVLATGLGKTLLSALDVGAFAEREGRLPRVLFLAHREELLDQAARTFRRALRERWPRLRVGFFVGDRDDLTGDLVLASVQKLARPEHLSCLEPQGFDYAVVDEVHHAAAASYRKVLDRIRPRFLLGLTATPERADGGDVLGLFDDHLAYRADLGAGIDRGLLVPFHYYGLRDEVDYANIPWRNHRFDPESLARSVESERRMERLFSAWREHPGKRTLVFCCSVRHAEFARDWLKAHGVRVEAVHSGPSSFDRERALESLRCGELDALCSVDLFNEGLDVPEVDRVVMLRPTESPVVFLQQLGRGLRAAPGKGALVAIDFVGNHKVFLERVRTLLSLSGKAPASLKDYLSGAAAAQLPEGCAVDLELEAKELLEKFLPAGKSELERLVRELLASRSERPKAGELYRRGYRPGALRGSYGSWLEFLESLGALSPEEAEALEGGRAWFRELETTPMTKSFKMVTLEALCEEGALQSGLRLEELAGRSYEILARSPELARDLEGVRELQGVSSGLDKAFVSYWRANPVSAWAGTGKKERAWFGLESGKLVPRLPIAERTREAFEALTRELVDYRLAQYRARKNELEQGPQGKGFVARVTWNQRDPILKLPPEDARPRGELDVRLPDGSAWQFRFQKEFCNVARPVGTAKNALPDLLRRWFGPGAGRPGTGFSVRFSESAGTWWAEPLGEVIALPERGRLVAFPDLRAAAGAAIAGTQVSGSEEVVLPSRETGPDIFAVRASGNSMEGGSEPIHDGDWMVLRLARSRGLPEVEGRVALVQAPAGGDLAFQIKRIARAGGGWVLRSDNPAQADLPTGPGTVPIALLAQVVRPESLAPPQGSTWPSEKLGEAFGFEVRPSSGRHGGHLFLFAEEKGSFVEPDRLWTQGPDLRPAETAFVLARASADSPWTYVGVGRRLEGGELWTVPDLPYELWRALGKGRGASRRLPDGAEEAARRTVVSLLNDPGPGGYLEERGRRCRVVGPAAGGGLRLDGGPGGFEERTVSLLDLAWAHAAHERAQGAPVDEGYVNRLRYLEGTPKESTRWIDTGLALVCVASALARSHKPG